MIASSLLAGGGALLGDARGFASLGALGSLAALVAAGVDLRLQADSSEVVVENALLLGTHISQDLALVDDGLLNLLLSTLN